MKLFRVLTAMAAVLATCTVAQAQIIFSDDFNSDNGGSASLNYTGFANWDVTNGAVDLYPLYGGLDLSVDLDGSSGAAGTFRTKTAFALTPGTYTFSFALGKNGGSTETMAVSVGSLFNETFTDSLSYPAPVTVSRTINVLSATNAAIQFAHSGGDNQGYVIDNVSLVRSSAAPEAGTLGLAALGLAPLALILRRRK